MSFLRRYTLLLFPLALAAILVNACLRSKKEAYHAFLAEETFKSLPREEQVLRCASCHPSQYENEQKGPHARAYQSLTEHRDFVNSDRYDCWFYSKRINTSFEGCVGCHAPQNLYETFLYDSLNNPAAFVEKMLAIPHPQPAKRMGAERLTGIDCLSCHYNGKELLSLKHVPGPNDSVAGKQTLAVITANNLVCYPCHFDVARSINPQIAIERTGSVLCSNCHQERDAAGKSTHYYYWQHDAKGKTNPKPAWVMDDFHYALLPDGHTGEITWRNSSIPHRISPGPEMIVTCEVLDADSNVLGTQKIWINQKATFDVEMYAQHDNNNLPGTLGQDVPLDGKPLSYRFPVKNARKAHAFKVSLVHKSQYWFPDSLGTPAGSKTYLLTDAESASVTK